MQHNYDYIDTADTVSCSGKWRQRQVRIRKIEIYSSLIKEYYNGFIGDEDYGQQFMSLYDIMAIWPMYSREKYLVVSSNLINVHGSLLRKKYWKDKEHTTD
jgi:hypothetical protein